MRSRFERIILKAVAAKLDIGGTDAAEVAGMLMGVAAGVYRSRLPDGSRDAFLEITGEAWDRGDEVVRLVEAKCEGVG